MKSYIRAASLLALPLFLLKADFSYDQTSKMTGGAMAGMMKMAGAFSKDARKAGEANVSTIAVKGNRMVHGTSDTAEIIDLDAETITRVNFSAKTYSVMTFAQMKQMMDDAAKQMQAHQKEGQGDMQFEVSLKDTGAKRMIAGLDTHEVVMTMKLKGKDEKSGAKGSMDVVTDMWLAPKVPGYGEVQAFYKRMGEKLSWNPGGNPMMGSRPEMAKAMEEMAKEGSKMDGMPVLQIVKTGSSVEGAPAENGNSTQAQPAQSTSQAPTAQSSDQPTSLTGALGGALAGRFGLGRKKKPQSDDSQSASSSQPQPQSQGQASSGSASLMEMTMEMSNFSSASVDGSKLEVPAGFSKVEGDLASPRGKHSR